MYEKSFKCSITVNVSHPQDLVFFQMGLVKIMTVTFLQGMYTLTFFPVPMVSPLLHLNVFVKTGFSYTQPNVALMTIPLSGVLTHFVVFSKQVIGYWCTVLS